jgi:hypothetical protein
MLRLAALESLEFTALHVGTEYLPEDYADWSHLTASGGAKLAEQVAPKVREMARRLGYAAEARGK